MAMLEPEQIALQWELNTGFLKLHSGDQSSSFAFPLGILVGILPLILA